MESGAILFNVNGFKYEIEKEQVLKMFGNSSILTKELKIGPLRTEIKVNRPRHVFEAIMDYCNTGHLHIPLNVCTGAFAEELEFWNISPQCLERCCYHRYATFIRDKENLDYFLQSLQPKENEGKEKGNSSNRGWRERVWQMVEGHGETVGSKVFGSLSLFFVVLAILNIAFSTVQLSQKNNTTSSDEHFPTATDSPDRYLEYPEYLANKEIYQSKFDMNNTSKNVTSLKNNTAEDADFFIFPDEAKQKVLTTSNAQDHTIFHLYIEHAANAFFTIELIIRLSCCPSRLQYFRESMNILDFILLVSSYGRYIVMLADTFGSCTDADFLLYLQMLRVLRILRFLKHVTAFQILCFSVKLGFHDLLIMFLFLTMSIIIFSNFLYYVESSKDVPSIPDAWWFSIVTMTTVGFGDITPKTWIGKMIGGVCALTGVMMFSLLIPIFVNTFQQIYQYVTLREYGRVRGHKNQLGQVSMREIEMREQKKNTNEA